MTAGPNIVSAFPGFAPAATVAGGDMVQVDGTVDPVFAALQASNAQSSVVFGAGANLQAADGSQLVLLSGSPTDTSLSTFLGTNDVVAGGAGAATGTTTTTGAATGTTADALQTMLATVQALQAMLAKLGPLSGAAQ